jgi:hypothetical protein
MTYSLENARLVEDGYATWEETMTHLPSRGTALVLDEFFDETEHHARSKSEGLRENSGTPISSPELIVGEHDAHPSNQYTPCSS